MNHSSIERSLAAPVLTVILLLLPLGASGQIRPGIERGDYWGDVRATYRSEALEQVGVVMDRWVAAWSRGDAEALTSAFAEDGVLVLGQVSHRGRARVRDALSEWRGKRLVQSLSDFDVRGEMAFATARYRLGGATGGEASTEAAAFLVWVFVKEDGEWRIRSLTVAFEAT
jgi:uncharacterized protein (TIGR02246 family)